VNEPAKTAMDELSRAESARYRATDHRRGQDRARANREVSAWVFAPWQLKMAQGDKIARPLIAALTGF
jgi:hypothetical protein